MQNDIYLKVKWHALNVEKTPPHNMADFDFNIFVEVI